MSSLLKLILWEYVIGPSLTIVCSVAVIYWFRDIVTNDSSVYVIHVSPSYLALLASKRSERDTYRSE